MQLWPASRQAARCASRYRVQLLVLRDAPQEWTPPQDIEIVRLGGIDVQARLEDLGGAIAAGTNPVVRCHLLAKEERLALARGGCFAVYLVIIGGPTGRDGTLARQAVLAQVERLGVVPFVRLPGYVAKASQCLPAIAVCLNTSLPGQTPQSSAEKPSVHPSRTSGRTEE
ncbi:MAG: hypothetical protein Q8S00_08190 [Deltaproteobacteria bacterium]|nr:hypothetical protein [Deltaproteobacteria bacterium]